MKKILVTGANGFIGKHLVRHLSINPHQEVIGIDFKDGDLVSEGVAENIISLHKPDLVIHLAAQVGIYFNEQDCVHAINSNAIMTLKVAQACNKHKAQLMYFSTSEVYGDYGNVIVNEDSPLIGKVTGIYAITKRWGEEVSKEYASDGLIIIRPSMPYGDGEKVGQGRRAMDNMLWQAYYKKPIIVHKGSFRSWCWIGDLTAAIQLIIDKQVVGSFNVGRDDDERSMLDIAKMSCDLSNASYILIQEIEPPIKKTMIKRLSTKKLKDLGWKPTVDLEKGINIVFEWIKNFDENGNFKDQ